MKRKLSFLLESSQKMNLPKLSKRVILNVNAKHRDARFTKLAVTRNGSWRGEDAIVRLDHPQRDETGLRGVGQAGGKSAREPGDGRRWWVLFCTLIYCRRYFLVGASWRLPHHRTRQWWPLDILFRIIARLPGPFYFGLDRTTPLRSAFFPDSSLSSRRDYARKSCAVSASNSAAARSPRIYRSPRLDRRTQRCRRYAGRDPFNSTRVCSHR